MRVSASVFMKLEVEVCVGSWDAAQPFEQLHKQAEREARQALQIAIGETPGLKMLPNSAVMHVITREDTK